MRYLTVFLLALVAACGGGGGSGGTIAPIAGNGDLYLTITDADGDFSNYSVDVVSLTLKKANGAVVEALPNSTRVNFADLVDLTEFVNAASVPNGEYIGGSIRLDYSNADIEVEVAGVAQQAKVFDANGAPITQLDLAVTLDNRNRLVIAPGRPALLRLDFDLAASNSVDLTKTPVEVTVEPFLVAEVDVADSKEIRVRGPLVSVDTAAGSYKVDVRPFHLRDARFGRIDVNTTADTHFEVDGVAYTGSAGIAAMATLAADAPTAAFGSLKVADKQFTATIVHAGSSVDGTGFDTIGGNVIARSGDLLTVRGVTFVRRDGSVKFIRKDVALSIGAGTTVLKDGERGTAMTTDSLSVGQRIRAFGTAAEDGNGGLSFDATAGRVRMHRTNLVGTVRSANPGALSLDLASIGSHRVSVYDFTGTGQSTAQDADPTDYEIATGALDLSRLLPDSPARVIGFVTPFGSAPADFEGRTVVDYLAVPAVLSIGWGKTGSEAAFTSLDASGITIDTRNQQIGQRHYIFIGPMVIDVKTLATPPRIVPGSGGRGMFAIGELRSVEVFSDFGDFAGKLAEKISAGAKVNGTFAIGEFDAATSTLTSRRVSIKLN